MSKYLRGAVVIPQTHEIDYSVEKRFWLSLQQATSLLLYYYYIKLKRLDGTIYIRHGSLLTAYKMIT